MGWPPGSDPGAVTKANQTSVPGLESDTTRNAASGKRQRGRGEHTKSVSRARGRETQWLVARSAATLERRRRGCQRGQERGEWGHRGSSSTRALLHSNPRPSPSSGRNAPTVHSFLSHCCHRRRARALSIDLGACCRAAQESESSTYQLCRLLCSQ